MAHGKSRARERAALASIRGVAPATVKLRRISKGVYTEATKFYAPRFAESLDRFVIEGDGVTPIGFDKSMKGLACDVAERMNQARHMAIAPLLAAAEKFMCFYEDLDKSNPGFMGKLCLQNYQQWNEAMMELPAAIRDARGK